MIRPATLSDGPALVSLIKAIYPDTIYAEMGSVDAQQAGEFFAIMLSRTGDFGKNSTLCWVAETKGRVSGLLLAGKQSVYYVGDKLFAMEMFFCGIKDVVSPQDMVALYRRFIAWAEADKRVVEIKTSSTDIFPDQPWRDLRPFYERRGFKRAGDVYVRRIQR